MAINSAYAIQSANYRRTWMLIFLFVAFVSAIFYVLGAYLNMPWLGYLGFFISFGQAAVGYFIGDKIALRSVQAKLVTEQEAPQLHSMMYNLSKISDIPKPKIYISPNPAPNAFACGRDPKHASVCFNQGIIDLLDKNELEGVAAHELAHIKNRDILIMTVAMVLASIIAIVADMSMRTMMFSNRDRDNDSGPIGMVVYLAVVFLSPMIAMIIQMSISRSREYLADATAATITRYPQGLSSALNKLYTNATPSKFYSASTNHLFISPPKRFSGQVMNLFSTHPPLKKRMEKLNNM